jgi:hypothetical protein
MGLDKKIVPFLPAAVEGYVESILQEVKLHDIEHYGWLNENDPDPEFIGHAMWQVDQPSIDFNCLFGQSPVLTRPEDIEKEILTVGEDFCGLMKACRLSIGLTMMWHRQAHNRPFDESPFFQLHYVDAVIKLAVASDRIRDLLIVASTGDHAKAYKRKDKPNRLYIAPFDNAEELLNDRGLTDPRVRESLAALPELAG